MYRGFWLWEARSVVFYEGLTLWGARMSNEAVALGWSAKEGPHVRGGFELGSYEDFDECIEDSGSGKFNL